LEESIAKANSNLDRVEASRAGCVVHNAKQKSKRHKFKDNDWQVFPLLPPAVPGAPMWYTDSKWNLPFIGISVDDLVLLQGF